MERVLEYQRCKIELGTEKSISTKRQATAEVTSGITDLMLPSNGFSTSCMEALENSSFKDGLLILVSESGSEWLGYQPLSILLALSSDKESMTQMLMITSISLIELELTI